MGAWDALKTFGVPIVVFVAGIWIGGANVILKRRYEIAEEIVTAARDGAAALKYVRLAHANIIQPRNSEFKPDKLNIAGQALMAGEDKLTALARAASQCDLHFGPAAAKPFRELMKEERKIREAYSGLMGFGPVGATYPSPDYTAKESEWKGALYGVQDDGIMLWIDACVTRIERRFKRHIQPDFWNLLNPLRR